jgi:stage II sporulation protein D
MSLLAHHKTQTTDRRQFLRSAGVPFVSLVSVVFLQRRGATQAGGVRVGIARDGGGYTIRTIALEEYVAGVLAGEAARDSSPAALQALAITIRTYALFNRGRHAADGFDLCDLTHCQVIRRPTAATGSAADATAGQVLMYRGAPAEVFYHASCGGRTEKPSDVWKDGVDLPYLPSHEDDACRGEPSWDDDLSAADLTRALRAGGFKGERLRDIHIAGRTGSGRVQRLRLDGMTPNEVTGQDLRMIVGRALGAQHIKSTAFNLSRSGSVFHFKGHGSGHGVGLCVIGSANLAARGESAEKILARYFPGLKIQRLGN